MYLNAHLINILKVFMLIYIKFIHQDEEILLNISEVVILALVCSITVYHIYLLFLNILIVFILTDQWQQQIKYIFVALLLWILISVIFILVQKITLNGFFASLFYIVSFDGRFFNINYLT